MVRKMSVQGNKKTAKKYLRCFYLWYYQPLRQLKSHCDYQWLLIKCKMQSILVVVLQTACKKELIGKTAKYFLLFNRLLGCI